jgi:hypothetical protein
VADLVITASQVKLISGVPKRGIAGVAVAAGKSIFVDPADAERIKLADANGTGDSRRCAGVALCDAAAHQPIEYADNGEVQLTTGSAIAAAGTLIVLSGNAGMMAPHGDIVAGWYTNVLGYMSADGKKLKLALLQADVAQA